MEQPTPVIGATPSPQTDDFDTPDEYLSLAWHGLNNLWLGVVRRGLREPALRLGTGLASLTLILLVVWVMGNFYLKGSITNTQRAVIAAPLPTPAPQVDAPAFAPPPDPAGGKGITRLAQIHTSLPAKPRYDIQKYVVLKGDTIFAIASKFNLRPETVLWGNYNVLADNPHSLRPGQELNILPVNGVLYEWHAGDGLNGVAKFYGVTPEEIINWPGNRLNPQTVGELAMPNIAPGTQLMVPGGRREFVAWSAPRITRQNPAVAKIFGPGSCGSVQDGIVGGGSFIWPTGTRFLSGFDYSPETNHFGIDIAGQNGNQVFASDGGVVVYAGWNDFGYGNVVVIDHGTGWQSLYAHLSGLNVACGTSVSQGQVIGFIGTTGNSSGPHLHFEMRSDTYGRVNPWNFLR